MCCCPDWSTPTHHFYQTLTRAVPAAQDANLFNWLKTLYPIWARMTPEDIYISTKTALAELALSGCTTASDHLYLFPNGSKLDDEIAAAQEMGVRIQASRGSMSLGESKGGLPPDSVVDSEESILKDSQRLIERYHDDKPGAMGADCAGALFAFLRDRRIDETVGCAGAPIRRTPAYAFG